MLWVGWFAFALCLCNTYVYLMAAGIEDLELREFDETAYQEWTRYSIVEKLPYILDQSMKGSFIAEFDKLSKSGKDGLVTTPVNVDTVTRLFGEFMQPEDFQQYFDVCDTDKNEEIDLVEYVVCRGWFDAYLNPHGLGEYDILESVIIHDYEEKRNDPTFRIPGYKYDEDGFIID